MSPLIKEHELAKAAVKRLYEPIAPAMHEVEQLLQQELRSEYPFIDSLVTYGFHMGGKRLRPALILLSAQAVGEINSQHVMLGAIIEMIHTATLVHDDVLDEATSRRHLATVNARWDNESSVLLGDFMLSHAFHLVSQFDTIHPCRVISNATNVVCEGELRQKGSRGDYEISEDEYLSIIEAKTAELYACSCSLAAFFAGADEVAQRSLDAYGRYLGIAFQIADDVLDIVGDESTTGKSLGTDLQKQKPTLPLIRVLEMLDEAERAQLIQALEGDPANRGDILTPYLERCDAVSYSREKALHFAELAAAQLASFSESLAVESLRRLTEFVVSRSL